jgi:hypothetical protein
MNLVGTIRTGVTNIQANTTEFIGNFSKTKCSSTLKIIKTIAHAEVASGSAYLTAILASETVKQVGNVLQHCLPACTDGTNQLLKQVCIANPLSVEYKDKAILAAALALGTVTATLFACNQVKALGHKFFAAKVKAE